MADRRLLPALRGAREEEGEVTSFYFDGICMVELDEGAVVNPLDRLSLCANCGVTFEPTMYSGHITCSDHCREKMAERGKRRGK